MSEPVLQCPICGKEPKVYEIKPGWTLSCAGDRHTIALYRSQSVDELKAAWAKYLMGESSCE